MEQPGGLLRQVRKIENPAMGIEAADEGAHHGPWQHTHPDPMTRLQSVGETGLQLTRPGANLVIEPFAESLQLRKVVAALRQQVSDTLHGELVTGLRGYVDASLATPQVLSMEAEKDLDGLSCIRGVRDEVLDLA